MTTTQRKNDSTNNEPTLRGEPQPLRISDVKSEVIFSRQQKMKLYERGKWSIDPAMLNGNHHKWSAENWINSIDAHGLWHGVINPQLGHIYLIEFENGTCEQAEFLGAYQENGSHRIAWGFRDNSVFRAMAGFTDVPFIVGFLKGYSR